MHAVTKKNHPYNQSYKVNYTLIQIKKNQSYKTWFMAYTVYGATFCLKYVLM
jgi:hypothetical protein